MKELWSYISWINKVAIEKYEKYVYKIISKIKNSYMFLHEMEDLHQAGCEGIMKALEGLEILI